MKDIDGQGSTVRRSIVLMGANETAKRVREEDTERGVCFTSKCVRGGCGQDQECWNSMNLSFVLLGCTDL